MQTGGRAEAKKFVQENLLSIPALGEIRMVKKDILRTLAKIGFISDSVTVENIPAELNANSEQIKLLNALILAGCWPKAARVVAPKSKFEQVAAGTVEKDNEPGSYKFFNEATSES